MKTQPHHQPSALWSVLGRTHARGMGEAETVNEAEGKAVFPYDHV